MAEIVDKIFGLSPEEVQIANQQRTQDLNKMFLSAPTTSQRLGGVLGVALGSGLSKVFPSEDPQLKRAVDMQSIQKNLRESFTEEQLQDPNIFFPELSKRLSQAGFQNEANEATLYGREEIEKYNKTKAEARLKELELTEAEQEGKDKIAFQNDLLELREESKISGKPITNDDIIEVASKYSSADKLLQVTSNEAEAERARADEERRLNIAREQQLADAKRQHLDKIELERIKNNNKIEKENIKQENKENEKTKPGSNERTRNNRVTVSANEVALAVQNLNVLTNGGELPATVGMFRDLKGDGILSATAAWMGTKVTPENLNQYDSIIRPVLFNIASLQNQGMAVRQFHMANLEKGLMSTPGMSHMTQLVKMGEFRQVLDAAIEGSLTNSTLNDEQRELLTQVRNKVILGIPFTGGDVLTFQKDKKRPQEEKFGDWLNRTGRGRGSTGVAEVDGKKVVRPPHATDAMWKKFLKDKGVTNVGH